MNDKPTEAKVRKTVTVACKLPHGLVLRLFKMEDHDVPVMGGGTKKEKRAVGFGEPVTLNGYAAPFGRSPKAEVVGGFALTHGVDADFFAEWLKQNSSLAAVKNGLIHAHEKADTVVGTAKERAELRSGLEPLNPTADPRNPRLGGLKVETAPEQAAA